MGDLENLERVKSEIDYAFGDIDSEVPMYLVVEIVMSILDGAEEEGRLNSAERKAACEYISSEYGYDF